MDHPVYIGRVSDGATMPTQAQLEALAASDVEGPITMLNLIRFRDQATEPCEGMSGFEAFVRYGEAVTPILDGLGARVSAQLDCHQGVIGPEEAEWDLAVLAEYPSRDAFLKMVSSPEYLEVYPFRQAAVADSRLILTTRAGQ